MKKTELGAKSLLFPMPTTLVGAMTGDKANYRTIAYCGMVQIAPPVLVVGIGKGAYTSEGIKKAGGFSVNLPNEDLVEKTDYCGLASGQEEDKSKLFTNFFGKLGNVPMIGECPVNIECRLINTVDLGGDHEVFFGEIVEVYCNEDALTGSDPDMGKIKPILFSPGDGKYWKTGESLAQAWDVGKNLLK